MVIPARNEAGRIGATLRSAAEARTGHNELEFIVVDDASDDGCADALDDAVGRLPGVHVAVHRLQSRVGVAKARNHGARHAQGDVLFMTDAHVRFSRGWDEHVLEHIRPQRILAATITDGRAFAATGCVLAVPFMGTYWNPTRPSLLEPVQIAACPGTAISRRLFERLGGYDDGMLVYGAAEPEFSVRAWLSGARVLALPDVRIVHRFKSRGECKDFLVGLRPFMVHNSVRFGMLYLDDATILQMMRLHAVLFSEEAREGLRLVAQSDVLRRREELRDSLRHDFFWFVRRFNLTDQAGRAIPTGSEREHFKAAAEPASSTDTSEVPAPL